MKILKADQIRSWDQYTIGHEPVASVELMERAAAKCFEWLDDNGWFVHAFAVFCGKGNNGGDGLAIARMLANRGCKVSVYILEFGHKGTEDFQTNLARLHQYPSVDIHFIQDENFHPLAKDTVVIDALFGSGLARPPDGITAALIDHINNSGCAVIAIDVPSGMSVDQSSKARLPDGQGKKSRHSSGKNIFELADLVVDTCVPIQDACVPLKNHFDKVGPVSTIGFITAVWMTVTTVAEILADRGVKLFIHPSHNVPGDTTAKERLDDALLEYKKRIAGV